VITLACFEDISASDIKSRLLLDLPKRFAPRRIHILPIRSSLSSPTDERIEARDYQTRYSASDGSDNPGWLVGYKAHWRTMKRNAQR